VSYFYLTFWTESFLSCKWVENLKLFHLHQACNKTSCESVFGQGFDPPHFHQFSIKMEQILYLKTIFSLSLIIIFSGCQTSQNTLTLPKKYQNRTRDKSSLQNNQNYTYTEQTAFYAPKIKKNILLPTNKNLQFYGSGYIKGILKSIYYDKNKHKWIYYIKGTDLSNGKLNSAKVYAIKKSGHINDFVYAIIKDGYIKSIYIYKSSKNYTLKKKRKIIRKNKKKKIIHKIYKKSPKTMHRKQIISAPKVQTVTF